MKLWDISRGKRLRTFKGTRKKSRPSRFPLTAVGTVGELGQDHEAVDVSTGLE